MITPRQTRLIRAADLHEFRRVIAALSAPQGTADAAEHPDRFIVVPTRGAATTLAQTLTLARVGADARPAIVTRDELYDAMHRRLADPPPRLNAFERDAMAQAAALQAARDVGNLPFQVRPGLVAEIVRFYDQLRRQSQQIKRFDELITDALGGGDLVDSGAERLLRQTRFLAQTFRGYEQRLAASGACDEHLLRERLMGDAPAVAVRQVIVTVPDWIADPAGLFMADFDLLNRLPHLAAIDIVSTEGTLASGFHERLDTWWPGIDVVAASDILPAAVPMRPTLVCPEPDGDVAPLWFTHRDREEELIAVARRLAGDPGIERSRVAVVFKRPLPYLYLAADTLGAAGIPFAVADALPLAAEPSAAVVDLVLDAIEADFPRDSVVALLRSPHLDVASGANRASVSALDHALSDARYLGQLDRLVGLQAAWSGIRPAPDRDRAHDLHTRALPALEAAAAVVRELDSLRQQRTASQQVLALIAFLETHLVPLVSDDPLSDRERRARAAVLRVLRGVAEAHAAHHDPAWSTTELSTTVRRWLGDETFVPDSTASGVRLVDDQAARYGEFDDMTIVGLVENEWPDRTRRNIFYPPALLKALNWPSEKDRRAAADARFLDLLASPARRIELSALLLDDEAIVSRSIQLDEVPRARLSSVTRPPLDRPLLRDEQLALDEVDPAQVDAAAQPWVALRQRRTPAVDPEFHGFTGPRAPRTWSVSALETYVTCPFKFFAQHVLRLEEEPDDEEVMDPRRQGQFVHAVFETFFTEWQDAGHRAITPATLPLAREMFAAVVDRALVALPEGEAALERTRLLGSPAAAGLGEAVFRMEAERPVPVVARLLEHSLTGPVTIQTKAGPRTITLRGKADRLDLLGDGTFRLIDYKLGWPPDRTRALQLPIYALSAEQQLDVLGRRWTLGEAMYLAFKGPKRVVALFATENSRAEALARAQQLLADTLDGIERGEFPPSPIDVFRCESCSFQAVCRKDYVGDI